MSKKIAPVHAIGNEHLHSKQIAEYPIVQTFIQTFGVYPSTIHCGNGSFHYTDFIEKLKSSGFKIRIINTFEQSYGLVNVNKTNGRILRNQVVLIEDSSEKKCAYLFLPAISHESGTSFQNHGEDYIYTIDDVFILHPFDDDNVQKIYDIIISSKLEYVTPITMSMVVRGKDGFMLKEYPINFDDSVDINFDLDLHYGTGFTDFHDKLIKRIRSKNKGISMFYGIPGTGKSMYIRRLIHELCKEKTIIYFPNKLIEFISDPDFIDFMSDACMDYENPVVLILEDADSLVSKKDNLFDLQSISNLRNISDGLLNDMLKIQIICTFNLKINEVEDAIKRKNRLNAKREFGKLNVEDANRLLKHLKLDMTTKEEMTVSDIYSMLSSEDDEELLKEEVKAATIGFKR